MTADREDMRLSRERVSERAWERIVDSYHSLAALPELSFVSSEQSRRHPASNVLVAADRVY